MKVNIENNKRLTYTQMAGEEGIYVFDDSLMTNYRLIVIGAPDDGSVVLFYDMTHNELDPADEPTWRDHHFIKTQQALFVTVK